MEVNRFQTLASNWHNHQKFDMFQSRQCAPLRCWINSGMFLTGLLYFVRRGCDYKGGHLYMAITPLMALELFLLRCPCHHIMPRHNYSPLVFLFCMLRISTQSLSWTPIAKYIIETRKSVALYWVKISNHRNLAMCLSYPMTILVNMNFDQRSQAVQLPRSANFCTSKTSILNSVHILLLVMHMLGERGMPLKIETHMASLGGRMPENDPQRHCIYFRNVHNSEKSGDPV